MTKLLENRKKKFADEGLFDETKKKLSPYMTRIIGIVTPPTGAVIRDIIIVYRIVFHCIFGFGL